MKRINIHDAKTNLSRYIEEIAEGETILLCRRNVPVARLEAVAPQALKHPNTGKRPLGLAAQEFEIPAAFYDPLPAELENAFAFAGESSDSGSTPTDSRSDPGSSAQ